jgi:hypothetical protein
MCLWGRPVRPVTVDGILAAVVAFVRFAVSRGGADVAVAESLSARRDLRFLPPGFERGGYGAGRRSSADWVRRRRVSGHRRS